MGPSRSGLRSIARRSLGIALVLACAGCMSAADQAAETEQVLSAAGFHRQPGDTAAVQAQLARLPARQLFAERASPDAPVAYLYADPDHCRCVFVGDEGAFQAYQRLSLQKEIADRHLRAAQLEQSATFYGGPWGWGPRAGFW